MTELSITSVFFAFATVFVLLLKGLRHFPLRFLAIAVFAIAYDLFLNYLILSKQMLDLPHLYRTSSPLIYLSFACFYLYTYFIIRDKSSISKIQWFHFAPAILHVIELIPFFAAERTEKINYIQTFLKEENNPIRIDEGWLPPGLHILLKCAIFLTYIIFQTKLIYEGYQKEKINLRTFPGSWLVTLVFLQLILFSTFLPYTDFIDLNFGRKEFMQGISLVMIAFSGIMLYAGFNPVVFVRKKVPLRLPGQKTVDSRSQSRLNDPKIQENLTLIEDFLKDHEPFLKSGYSLSDLSEDVHIARHQISIAINEGLSLSFTDLMNKLRLEHIKDNWSEYNIENTTIEGLAYQAGFNSRTTFYHAVKKFTGKTPSEFISNLNKTD